MRYEQEMLEKIMYYDREGIISTFPLYVYRTKGSVSRKALEAAVGYAIQCHPRFGCRLAEDAKGPYLETNPEQPIIPELNPDEMFFYGDESNHYYPWIVGIHENEIIYTGFHGIADGIGATIFMRTVLYYYFKEQGIECDPGKAVTLQDVTPEYLERDTECTIRKNGTEDRPASYQPKPLRPSVFPEDLLEEPKSCAVHNIAINAICAVTTDRVINLMLMDGTKNEQILKALKKRLADNRIAFDDRVMKKNKGVFFKRP